MTKRIISFGLAAIIIVLVAAGLIYPLQLSQSIIKIEQSASNIYQQAKTEVRNRLDLNPVACAKPITYRLGQIDYQFGISQQQLLADISEAQKYWNLAAGRELFAYSTSGEVAINLIYDYRQEATDKLKKLGIVVKHGQQFYEELKAKYDALSSQYEKLKAKIDLDNAAVEKEQLAYNAEVAAWNQKGGAPKPIYDSLQSRQAALQNSIDSVNAEIAQLNELGSNLNAEGTALNGLIEELNLNVNKYNNAGQQNVGEFTEGDFVQDKEGKRINVYEYDSQQRLVRLLEHELGHSLGLMHTSGTTDIMYYLNEGTNRQPTANDISQLKTLCHIDINK